MDRNTWNPVTGCTKISDGCKNCYASVMAQRLKLMGNKKYVNAFEVTLHEYCLTCPLKWKKPSLIFVNSMYRIDSLRTVNAKVRFLSFEPLIDEVKDLDLEGIDWAIIGGESGFKARRMDPDWVLSIKNDCDQQGFSFYFKQWGGINKKKNGRLLLGQTWDAMPEIGAK